MIHNNDHHVITATEALTAAVPLMCSSEAAAEALWQTDAGSLLLLTASSTVCAPLLGPTCEEEGNGSEPWAMRPR